MQTEDSAMQSRCTTFPWTQYDNNNYAPTLYVCHVCLSKESRPTWWKSQKQRWQWLG